MNSLAFGITLIVICVTFNGIECEVPLHVFANAVNCSESTTCETCMAHDGHCVFWFCHDDEGKQVGEDQCEAPGDKKPSTLCSKGAWKKIQKGQNETCPTQSTSTAHVQESEQKPNDEVISDKVDKVPGSIDTTKNDVNCSESTTCDDCMSHDGHCDYWFCEDSTTGKQTGEEYSCEGPSGSKPNTTCHKGSWKKVQKGEPDTCASINPNSTTTTTTTSTTSTTTTKPTTSPTQPPSTPQPDHNDRKLTGWTIAGIVISSLLVILILVGVSYKKVMKIYRARNPYRNLD